MAQGNLTACEAGRAQSMLKKVIAICLSPLWLGLL